MDQFSSSFTIWGFVSILHQSFINWPLSRSYFAVGKSFDGLCSEVEIRVNVWTVRREKRTGRCGQVAVSECSTVFDYWVIYHIENFTAWTHIALFCFRHKAWWPLAVREGSPRSSSFVICTCENGIIVVTKSFIRWFNILRKFVLNACITQLGN